MSVVPAVARVKHGRIRPPGGYADGMQDRNVATPSRPLWFELLLGGGLFLVGVIGLTIAGLQALGGGALLFFVVAFAVGLILWVPLLVVFRRLTARRGVGARVLGSLAAAVIAIAIDLLVVALLTPLAGPYWGLLIVFAFVDAILFLITTLLAAFVAHLTAVPDTARR